MVNTTLHSEARTQENIISTLCRIFVKSSSNRSRSELSTIQNKNEKIPCMRVRKANAFYFTMEINNCRLRISYVKRSITYTLILYKILKNLITIENPDQGGPGLKISHFHRYSYRWCSFGCTASDCRRHPWTLCQPWLPRRRRWRGAVAEGSQAALLNPTSASSRVFATYTRAAISE